MARNFCSRKFIVLKSEFRGQQGKLPDIRVAANRRITVPQCIYNSFDRQAENQYSYRSSCKALARKPNRNAIFNLKYLPIFHLLSKQWNFSLIQTKHIFLHNFDQADDMKPNQTSEMLHEPSLWRFIWL